MRLIYILVAVGVFLADQVSKWAILSRLSSESLVQVIPGLMNLVRTENRGIAFGMFSRLSSNVSFTLIVVFSTLALGLVCYLLWTNAPSAGFSCAALALILGGAAGNLFDRIVRGSVVDFIDFYFGSYHWYTFNIADCAIVIGASLLVIDLWFGRTAKAESSCLPGPSV
jgi:signal peptidase II